MRAASLESAIRVGLIDGSCLVRSALEGVDAALTNSMRSARYAVDDRYVLQQAFMHGLDLVGQRFVLAQQLTDSVIHDLGFAPRLIWFGI